MSNDKRNFDRNTAFERHRPAFSVVTQLFGGIITRILVFLQQIVITYNFGSGSYSEIFFAISIVPLLVAEYFPATITQTFIPVAARLSARDSVQAQRFISSLVSYVVLVFMLLSVIVFLAPQPLILLLAPGLPDEMTIRAQQFLRMISASLVFLGVGGALIGLLQFRGQFTTTVTAQLVYRATALIGCLFITSADRFWAMGWVFVIAAIARFIVLLFATLRQFSLYFTFSLHNDLSAMLPRVIPVSIAFLGVQAHLIIDRYWLSSSGTGTITAVTIASTLGLLLSGLIAIPVTTVMLPLLADQVSSGALQKHRHMYQVAFDSILILLFPCLAIIVFYRTELVGLMYGRGNFDAKAIYETSSYIFPYAFGVVALSLHNIVASTLYSLENVKLPAGAMTISLAINAIFSPILNYILGSSGVAWATSLALITGTIVLLLAAQGQHLIEMNWSSRGGEFARIVGATIGLVGVLFMWSSQLDAVQVVDMNSLRFAVDASLHIIIGLIVYSIVLLCTRSSYAISLWSSARRRAQSQI